MRIILSRKGFDSANGGIASPVLSDGTMLSLPIPANKNPQDDKGDFSRFSDLRFDGKTYFDIIKSLKPNFENRECHLDPDIRTGVINPPNWVEAFGQCSAQGHLQNQKVGVGDLFLFFGWFKETKKIGGKLEFVGNDFHAIYGYMQIGEIIKGDAIKNYAWHPHAQKIFLEKKRNTLYLPTEKLTINGEVINKKGCGVFQFNKDLVLTKKDMTRSKWELSDWMKDAEMSYRRKDSINSEENYFKSADIGQEFVIQPHAGAIEWAKKLLLNSTEVSRFAGTLQFF